MTPPDAAGEISPKVDAEPKRRRFRRLAFYFLVLCVVPYLVVEVSYTALHVAGIVARPSYMIYDESAKTMQFDPVLGYRLTAIPSRLARITEGEVEFTGASGTPRASPIATISHRNAATPNASESQSSVIPLPLLSSSNRTGPMRSKTSLGNRGSLSS